MLLKVFLPLYFLLLSTTIFSEGFSPDTLVATAQELKCIKTVTTKDYVTSQNGTKQSNYPVTYIQKSNTNNYVNITFSNVTLCSAIDQKFYSITRKLWVEAQNLKPSELLLCLNASTIMIDHVEIVYAPKDMFTLTIQTSHIYCVTPYKIITHNCDPISFVAGTTMLSISCLPAAPIAIAAQAITGTIMTGIGIYSAYKKHKKNKTFTQIQKELKTSTTNSPNPKKPDDDDDDEDNHSNIKKNTLHSNTNATKAARQKLEKVKSLLKDFDKQIEKLAKKAHKKTIEKLLEVTPTHKLSELDLKTELFYKAMRTTHKDIDAICKNTRISKDIITKIKQHIFVEEHILREGIERFFPDADMAAAWNRLIENEYVYADLKMLQHEYAESLIMEGIKIAYDDAHYLVNQLYNWDSILS